MGPESERKPLVAVGEDNGLTADQSADLSGPHEIHLFLTGCARTVCLIPGPAATNEELVRGLFSRKRKNNRAGT